MSDWTRVLCTVLLGLTIATSGAAADFHVDLPQLNELTPRPGLVIDGSNSNRYAHLLDPDFLQFISAGAVTLEVGEPLSFDPHPAFIHATERLRGQAALAEERGQLSNFSQGLPFPGELQHADKEAGERLAWNMRYAYTGDSGVLPEIHWQLKDWRSEKVEFEMLFEARLMRFMYRHVLEPIPFVDPNPQDAYGAFFLNAIDAGSYDGTQALVFANRDDMRELNGWVYIPPLNRTQSLASFSTEESMFGSDILPTDFIVYSGRLTDMDWAYLGETYMLLPFYRHDLVQLSPRKARKYEYWHVDFNGRAGCFPQVQWQVRPVRILVGTARDPAARAQKRILYVDAQTHVVALWKVFREDDALWKFALTSYAHPNSHLPENNESGAPIPTAFSSIDITTNRCTTVQLLTRVNVADVTAEDFDTGRMQSGGGRGFRRR